MDIHKVIFDLANEKGRIKSSDVLNAIHNTVSRQYISLLLRRLVKRGILIKGGSTAGAYYVLTKNEHLLGSLIHKRFKRENLKEHEVLDDINRKVHFMKTLSENVRSLFDYAFSEMLNNAIEHSLSKYVEIEVSKDDKNLWFVVNDFGVGVFKNVMKKRSLKNELEAMQDLLKGKTTTQPRTHSGEGIFFTSKTADIYQLDSFEYSLRLDNKIKDVFLGELRPVKVGTRVYWLIDYNSDRHLQKIFQKFETDHSNPDFDKTEIQIKLYIIETIYISRSQARRILVGLEKFKSIIFDFYQVPNVGQAFVDELFRVFPEKYPNIKVTAVNMNETVRYMVERVDKSSSVKIG